MRDPLEPRQRTCLPTYQRTYHKEKPLQPGNDGKRKLFLIFSLLGTKVPVEFLLSVPCSKVHGKNKYWEIYMTECSTFRYVQKLLKTRSTVLVQLDQ